MHRRLAQTDTAYASQEETGQAILCVLQVREEFLRRKNITNARRVLTPSERGELVQSARQEYEESEEQLALQERDAVKGKAAGKGSKGLQNSLKQQRRLNNFLKQQRRKRWYQHLQRVCGSKQMWEVLAFSGRFDVDLLTQALKGKGK